ncbi:hypothetical protein J4421_03870 [Candidatus Woesearchaeota archaeon]|nr:hypothetical protein [Candidatus Woesearchaeota archaeon]
MDTAHTFQLLTKLIMQQAQEKGWGTKPEEISISEKIALIHSEVSEAYEAYRHQKNDHFAEELGDIIFRTLHLAGCLSINVEKEIVQKLEKNQVREWKSRNEKNSKIKQM